MFYDNVLEAKPLVVETAPTHAQGPQRPSQGGHHDRRPTEEYIAIGDVGDELAEFLLVDASTRTRPRPVGSGLT